MGSNPISRPHNMTGFLDVRISTLAGIITLLLVAGAVGFMIFYQFNQIVNIQMRTIESQLEK
jgi:hypothetical protein